MNAIMLRLGLVNPVAMHTLEMWAAGWSQRKIADELGVSKQSAATLLEVGFSIIEFGLVVFDRPTGRQS